MVPAGACKSAAEDRDHLVKFIDNDDGIFIAKSAGEAAWQMEGDGCKAPSSAQHCIIENDSKFTHFMLFVIYSAKQNTPQLAAGIGNFKVLLLYDR